jgi:hypothetical protein
MCLICVEFDKSTMTTREARRALGEMRVALDPAHVAEIEAKLTQAEAESEDAGPMAAP